MGFFLAIGPVVTPFIHTSANNIFVIELTAASHLILRHPFFFVSTVVLFRQ
jgi:hypothetical protein